MSEELLEKTTQQMPEPVPVKKKRKNPLKGLWSNKKKRKRLIIAVVILLIVAFVVRSCTKKPDALLNTYVEEAVAYRPISETLSGNGTLEPADSYIVTTLKEGEIISADFEEGDTVTKDTVLYVLDDADVSSKLEDARLSLDKAQRSYEKAAYAQSPISGVVASLNVKAGDVVHTGETVATVRDSSTMTLKVPFATDDAAKFYVGQKASVVLDNSFETLTGKVTMVSAADTVLSGNRIVRYVTISISNPGGLSETQAATATISGCGSSESATLQFKAAVEVAASAGGTISTINVKEGARVSAGQAIVTFVSNAQNDQVLSASENLHSAELGMEKVQDELNDFSITSPIDGTIVDKAYKAGDKVESGKTLCTIYDLSYLELVMDIDELDIKQVKVGQSVEVKADAVQGKTFTGTITKISMAGKTNNGTTTYPVSVRIDGGTDLWPGMNVDAKILLVENDNALSISSTAVERGNKVLITAGSPSAANALPDPAPEGYVYVAVETGISDNNYIEITSGLQEGDSVAYIPTDTSNNSMMNAMYGEPEDEPEEGGDPDNQGEGGGSQE